MGQQHKQHQPHKQHKQHKIAYLDCPTGIAGDMCLGALVSAGVPLTYLIQNLASLGLTGEYRLWSEIKELRGQVATKVHVSLGNNPDPSNSHHADPHHADPHHSHAEPQAQPHSHPPVRTLGDITQLIQGANLPSPVVHKSLAIFQTLAAAEAAVHGTTIENVHFHEVGATDALVDIVGTCLGLHWLGTEALYCSALPTGGGTVWAAHGRLPVPAPAVLQLLAQGRVPVYGNGIDRELVTPTGAAIVVTLAQGFGPCPPLILHKIGLGAGNHSLPIPNILRLWVGESPPAPGSVSHQTHHSHHFHPIPSPQSLESPPSPSSLPATAPSSPNPTTRHASTPHASTPHASTPNPTASHPSTAHASTAHASTPDPTASHASTPHSSTPTTITLLQTQLDDLSPQAIAYVTEELLKLGALDVFTQAITMKKGRSGILLSVIAPESLVNACETLIFRETSTLGIRRLVQERRILQRRLDRVETEYGAVAVKIAWDPDLGGTAEQPLNIQPEYEDCAAIARQTQLPWQTIHRQALQGWFAQHHPYHPLK